MKPTKTKRRWLARLGFLLPGLVAGCSTTGWCRVDNCATVPAGAQPAPNGTYVHRMQEVQAAKAEQDDFVVYKYEWYMGGPELGPFGRYHLNEMIKRLPFVPFPILIQAHTADGELNEARRCNLVRALQLNGIPDAEQRVVLGFPEAEGLYGEEADRIYGQMLSGQTQFNQGLFGAFNNPFNQYQPFGGFGGFGGGVGYFGAGGINGPSYGAGVGRGF